MTRKTRSELDESKRYRIGLMMQRERDIKANYSKNPDAAKHFEEQHKLVRKRLVMLRNAIDVANKDFINHPSYYTHGNSMAKVATDLGDILEFLNVKK